MRKLRLRLSEGVYDYAIVALSATADLAEARCDKCNGALSMHGELLQWGFWEDTHTYLCACRVCDRKVAVEQIMPVYEVTEHGEQE